MKENWVLFYLNQKEQQKVMIVAMPSYCDISVEDLQSFFDGFGAKLLRVARYNELVGA